jgi:hypothetical protein
MLLHHGNYLPHGKPNELYWFAFCSTGWMINRQAAKKHGKPEVLRRED